MDNIIYYSNLDEVYKKADSLLSKLLYRLIEKNSNQFENLKGCEWSTLICIITKQQLKVSVCVNNSVVQK